MKLLINTVRDFDKDQAREHLIGSKESLEEKLPIAQLNVTDSEKLNLTTSLNIKISTKYGTAIMKHELNDRIPEGVINIPISIWSNQLTGIEGFELHYKNIEAEIEATRDPIPTINQLIEKGEGNEEIQN